MPHGKLSQQLKQEQSLALSPVQLLTSKLVELTTIELEHRIERELEENPALEEGGEDKTNEESLNETASDDSDWELGEYASEDDIPAYKLRELQERQSYKEEVPFASSTPSLDSQLLEQLSVESLSPIEEQLARYIIGNITEEGYLSRSVVELQNDLLFKEGLEVSIDTLQSMVQRIKMLDPAGIGAEDLRECLLLQLERKESSHISMLAQQILQVGYDDFVHKRFDKLIEAFASSKDEIAEVYTEISRLNPKPGIGIGGDYEEKLSHYNPDFIVSEEENGLLQLSLVGEKDIRPLRLSEAYQTMFEQSKTTINPRKRKETQEFLKHKLEQAQWFIEALTQRQLTLKRTMQAIVDWQKAFFLSGDIADLRPMILKDIANITGLDISTISRVSNSKTVQTDYGVYPIKFFFGEGLRSNQGDEVSTKAIKQILQDLIDTEDKSKPLTDEELTECLSEKGYNLARRTIAKYRESLKIPIARLRRALQ